METGFVPIRRSLLLGDCSEDSGGKEDWFNNKYYTNYIIIQKILFKGWNNLIF